MKLELQQPGQEVAGVRDVGGDVILGARIEVLLAARHRRVHPLIPATELPPGLVVVAGFGLARKDIPPPLVDEQAEGQEGHLRQRFLHLHVDQALVVPGNRRQQTQPFQVSGRDGQRERVAEGLVKAFVGTGLIERGELVVGVKVIVVAELVVDRDQILLRGLDAHLDPQIVVHADVLRAGVAHHLPVARLDQHRPLPEGRGQGIEPQGREELLAGLHHLDGVPPLRHQRRRDIQGGLARVRLDQRL